MPEPMKDRRRALERVRRWGRMRSLLAVFAIGVLIGAGLAHLATPTPPEEPDLLPPTVVSVEPPEGTFLRGAASFRIAFDEPLAASPLVTLAGETDLPVVEAAFDGRSYRGRVDLANATDGSYEMQVTGLVDYSGNRGANFSVAYAVDATPPEAEAFAPTNATSQPFDVTWNASDGNGSGIARVELWSRADGGAWTLLVTSPEDRGTYRMDPGDLRAAFDFAAVAMDRAENREGFPSAAEASVLYSPVPPSASLLAVDGYWFREPLNVSATFGPYATTAELRYYFAPDNATWQGPFATGNGTEWTFPFPLGAGHYRLYARARDAGGVLEVDQPASAPEVLAAYDASAPSSRLTPVSPYWQTGNVTMSANATDDRSGVASVELLYAYRPNGTIAWSPWTLAGARSREPWTFEFTFPEGDGRYALSTRARDLAGREEALPIPAERDIEIGINRGPPSAPVALPPAFIEPDGGRANLTWLASPPPDLVTFEVHGWKTADFVADLPCVMSTTCIARMGRDDRSAWVPLPSENATQWFLVRGIDEGGLASESARVGAIYHGLGYDTPDTYALSSPLPIGIAWSERIEYIDACKDCTDAFRIVLAEGAALTLSLAVPYTGDFRLLVVDAGLRVVATSDARGYGIWERLDFVALAAGMYYVVVDHAGVTNGGRNEGWYTLGATLS